MINKTISEFLAQLQLGETINFKDGCLEFYSASLNCDYGRSQGEVTFRIYFDNKHYNKKQDVTSDLNDYLLEEPVKAIPSKTIEV